MKSVLILILITTIISCDANVEFSGATNYIYRNSSDHHVKLESYVDNKNIFEFSLNTDKEYIRELGPVEGENNGPIYSTRFSGNDSILVYFNDTLVIQYDKGRVPGNPMRTDNYELIEANEEPYIFLFEFTNEDYERALKRGTIVKSRKLLSYKIHSVSKL